MSDSNKRHILTSSLRVGRPAQRPRHAAAPASSPGASSSRDVRLHGRALPLVPAGVDRIPQAKAGLLTDDDNLHTILLFANQPSYATLVAAFTGATGQTVTLNHMQGLDPP